MSGTGRHDYAVAQGGIGWGGEGQSSPISRTSDSAGPIRNFSVFSTGRTEETVATVVAGPTELTLSRRGSPRQDNFAIGTAVWGQWTNNKWYQAIVIGHPSAAPLGNDSRLGLQSYFVRFEDGIEATLLPGRVMRCYTDLSTDQINHVDEPQGTEPSLHSYFTKLQDSAAMDGPPSRVPGVIDADDWSDSSDDPTWTDFSEDDLSSPACETEDEELDAAHDPNLPLPGEARSRFEDECIQDDEDASNDAAEPELGSLRRSVGICNIPLVTNNLNGFSLGSATSKPSGRYKFIAANVAKLAHDHRGGVLMFQETKLQDGGVYAELKTLLPGWHIAVASNVTGEGGVMTCVCPTLLKDYNVVETKLQPTEDGQGLPLLPKGRVLNIMLTPIQREDEVLLPSVSITNFYLPAGGKHKEIAIILNLVRELIPRGDCNVVAGDFNFVLQAADHSPSRKWVRSSYYDITEDLQLAWDSFAASLGLTEVAQDQHTYFDIKLDDPSRTSTARLDRIYTSHCQADFAVYEACCHIVDVPYSIFSKFQQDSSGGICKSQKVQSPDHAPVGVLFIPTETTAKRGTRIPRWVAERPEFSQAFNEGWKPPAMHLHPEQCLMDLKDAMYAASKTVLNAIKSKARAVTQAHGKLAIATALLRLATKTPAPTQAITNLLRKFPQLSELCTAGGARGLGGPSGKATGLRRFPDIVAIKSHINQILAEASHEQANEFAKEMMARSFPFGDNEHDTITNPHQPKAKGAAERLKVWLPSLRHKIKRLRAARGADGRRGEITEDPVEMAKIAKAYWKQIWAKQPRHMRPRRATYLGHVRRIKQLLTPVIPSAHYVADIIIGTNNSCAGPDGIPFEVYRQLVRAVAPVIHNLLVFFGNGGLPSEEFNKGFLFLLPKKDTMLPADTRPISVTNADNRITAKVVVFAIGPALSDSVMGIHLDQKGGIAGRVGTDHVKRLSEKFYTAAEDGATPYDLFFMDTRKAFDSVHHDFIFGVLELFGLPSWVLCTIRALLHKVSVTPNFGQTTHIWIRIRRGVKQGCPLSPWLFAMCMDVLIRRLREIPGVDVYAYVDDIALGATDFRVFAKCMRVIDLFSRISGLGINHDKTKGLCSQDDGRYEAWAQSRHCPWQGHFEIAHEYVYLGFLTGKYVTAAGVYRTAFKKFRAKLAAYKGALKSLTPCKRFDVFNIFILPILSYLAPFYSLPAEGRVSHKTAKQLVRKAMVTFGGSGYPYAQLIAPAAEFGFGNPVKDVWGYTVSVLVAEADLTPFRGVTNVVIREKVSMRVSKQRSHMAAEFVNWHLFVHTQRGKPYPRFDPDDYELPMPKRRKAIYQIMVRGALKCSLKHHVFYRDITKKLQARSLPHGSPQLALLKTNFGLIRSSVSNTARYHQVAMLHNAVATNQRARRFSGATPDMLRCRACGADTDAVTHILGDDCVAAEARQQFGVCIQYDLHHTRLGATSSWAAAFLMFRGGDYRAQAVNAIVIFNYATWIAQVTDFRKSTTPPNRASAAKIIVRTALSMWARVRSSKWKVARTLQGMPLRAPRKFGFGSSSNRSAEDKARAKAEAIRLVQSMVPEAAIGFTDGSAIPNPGPCGTGAVLYMPEHRHLLASAHTTVLTSATAPHPATAPVCRVEGPVMGPLASFTGLANAGDASEGSNNIGELWGPAMLIQLLEWHEAKTGTRHTGPIAIFIDSQLTIDVLRYKARPKANTGLVHAVRQIIRRRNQFSPVFLYWIAGHADVVENDMVDGCAKRGARMAKHRPGDCMDIKRSQTSLRFLPPSQAPYLYHALPP